MEELSLRDFLELAREFGVQSLTCNGLSVCFPPKASPEPQYEEPQTRPATTPHPSAPVQHPSLWGPAGSPTFQPKAK